MNQITTQQMIDVRPEMVLEIASGLEDPSAIAARYGFSEAQWERLLAHKPFHQQVNEKKKELQASGYSFRLKAAIAAELILTEVSNKALAEGASFGLQLEALKFTAKAAGLDAPQKDEAQTGATFNISIDLGGGNIVKVDITPKTLSPPETIDITDISEASFTDTDESLDFEAETALDDVPHHLQARNRGELMEIED